MSFSTMLSQMSEGMLSTLGIFALTLLFSLPLGFVIAFGRMSKIKIINGTTRIFISVMRGTPLMLQLMVVYFFPFYLFGLPIASWRFPSIIVGFAVNYAAYFAEIYRSGIEAIPKGQYEAASLLGYSRAQTFIKIILPQVIKIILPSVTNEIITLVKDTSLAYSLSYMEMFSMAKQIAARETTLMPFAISAVFYYVFNLLVTVVMEKLEKKMNYYK
ncbi:MAG: amino acid ABC transporter permease [Eubacterium sp.]|jgi:polar amino acid transport system permease protein|nr:amino acid ABC transporter permease [Eubacterium sp.]